MQTQQINFGVGFALQNKGLIVHVIVVILLTSVALWDTASIIDDYINDNRYTLVRVTHIEDNFSFLEGTRLLVRLDFDQTIFPDLWQNDTNKLEAFDIDEFEASQKIIAKAATDQETNVEMSLSDRVATATLFSSIDVLDAHSVFCAVNRNNESCSLITTFFYLDDVLKNRSYLEDLKNRLWSHVQPRLFRSMPFATKAPSDMSLFLVSKTFFGVTIPLSVILSRHEPNYTYAAGILGDRLSIFKNNTVEPRLQIRFANYFSQNIVISKGIVTDIYLQISNIGVYDKRVTTKCTDEPELGFPSVNMVSECTPRAYFEIVASYCQCLPHKYRDEYKHLRVANFEELPSCSTKMYSQCMASVQHAMANRPPCQPCTTKNNQYSLSISIFDGDEHADRTCQQYPNEKDQVCSRGRLTFQCNDFSYATYEERYQINLAQLVSQVGGDVGLYTGISVLGVWQFLSFAYSLYQRRRSERASMVHTIDGTLNTSPSGARASLAHYLTSTNTTESCNVNRGQKSSNSSEIALEARFSKIEESISEMKKQMNVLLQQVIGRREDCAIPSELTAVHQQNVVVTDL